ncbi:MAG TPA: hypothetical protein VFM23_04135 [Gemmatimonadales bacterium]|nr:hypothetical protein [Gemmatimonadales bacterium]
MNDIDRLEQLRGYFHTGEMPIATAECLDDGTIAALADGALPNEASPFALQHIAACPFCRRAVASVRELLNDRAITHEIDLLEGRAPGWRRIFKVAVPLAAAATLLVLLWSPSNDDVTHRGSGARSFPTPIGPRGTVANVERMEWSGVPGSDRYRVTVFTAQGGVVYETEGADTALTLPDSIQWSSGARYLWKVEARTGWNRWATSDLVDFTIVRAPPP